ncbi:unnamed protein product [Hermetia illucens]|uniref:BTB domain-containing protein n=2 Tax=Hermetia illucens TaxID=343691 RepID=A0A7R8UP82_HERIL|nr:unnamed protein product [Hermetia illucens]
MAQSQPNCQYTTRYCWEADKVKTLIRLRAELSPLFTGKRNASKYAWAVVERELNVPLPLSKIIKKWNNLLQEYKAIKLSEEPKRREWPFFTLMDVYFSDQVNDPTLRLFSSTKTLKETIDDSVFEDDPIISSAIAAATQGSLMDISELVQVKQQQKMKSESESYDDMGRETPVSDYSSVADEPKKHVMNAEEVHRRKPEIPQSQSEYNVPPPHQGNPSPPEHHTIDQYLLSWNNFHGNMCKGFHSLQKDEKMVDVTIAAGGKIFKAHKLVLSVCSPYFQKIFLDHPCSHPILFMTDVDCNHMQGLLDFMYSGQVNVKYEDLPNFLKVAEAMRIKGLHTESTTDTEQDLRIPRPTEESINRYRSSTPSQNSHPASSSIYGNNNSGNMNANSNAANGQNVNNNNNNSNAVNLNTAGNTTPIPSPNFLTFRDHIRSKSAMNEAFMNNANNNNNNIGPEKYSIQQTNSSNKILDGRKHPKYFAKRKMLMQYNQDILREKRNKELEALEQRQQQSPPINHPMNPINDNFRIKLPELVREEALNLVQNIKQEPGTGAPSQQPPAAHNEPEDRRQEEREDRPIELRDNEEAENEAKAALLKLKHSILEQNLMNNNNNNNTSTNNNNYSNNNNNNTKLPVESSNVSMDRNLNAVCS